MAQKPKNNVPNPEEQTIPQTPYQEGQQAPNMQEPDMYGQPNMNQQPMPNDMYQQPNGTYQQTVYQQYQQPLPNQPAYQQPYNDPLQNLLYTPPAGIYPKMDSSGRVIKYKKRGGVFAFFMGLFASLFILIFCGGLAISYFYYCVKFEDITGTVGVDTSFLPVETNNKTIQEVVQLLVEYKDGYTNMTLGDLDDDFGINLEEMLFDNLGITITGLYDIEITIAGVNDGDAQSIKDIRIQDIMNNTDTFIDQLIPEVYKRIDLGTILDFAHIDLTTFHYPIFTDALFDVTPNPTFVIGTTTYQLDFNTNHVLNSEGEEFVPYVGINTSTNQFTLNSVTYTINEAKTTLTSSSSTINLVYVSTMKTLDQLSIYQIINSVVPNYIGGDKLTIGFIQTALGLNLIPDTEDEDSNYLTKYGAILNTVISELNVDDLLDSITIRTVLELTGIDFIPLDDDRYDALLDSTIGTINPDDLLSQLTVGAVLDLIPSLDLTSFKFVNDDLRAQYLDNVMEYALTLTIGEVIEVPEQIYEFEHFVLTEGGTEYYINGDEISTISTIAGSTTLPRTFTIDSNSYTIAEDNLCTYTTKTTAITTSAGISTVVINGTTYQLDLINNKVLDNTGVELSPTITITSNKFVLDDTTYTISTGNTQLNYITPYTTISITAGSEGANSTFVLNSTTYQLDLINSKVLDNTGNELSPAVTITNKQFTIGNNVCTINTDNTEINYVISSATVTNNRFTLGGTEYKLDYDTLLFYVHQADIITSGTPAVKTFTLGSTTYTIDEANGYILNGTSNIATINSASSTTEQLLYSVRNITIQDLMSGDFDEAFSALKGMTIGDLMGSTIPETFSSLNNVSIGDILEDPSCLMNALNDITIGAVANIDETDTLLGGLANITLGNIITNPSIIVDTISNVNLEALGINPTDPLLGNLATLTIGNIMDDSNCVLTAMRSVTLSALGISGTDPLLGGIASLTIGNIMDDPNSILDEVRTVTLSDLGISGTDPLLGGIATLTIGNILDNPNCIINEVRTVTLSDLGMSTSDPLLGDIALLTIGGIMDDPDAITNSIQSKTIGDLGITNSGMISLLTVTDDNGTTGDTSDDVTYTGINIPISMINSAFNNFNIGANTLCGLYDAGLLPSLESTAFDRSSGAFTDLTPEQKTTVQAQTFQNFFDYVIGDGALARYIASLTV